MFKAEVAIADLDRHYYHTHKLTLALHPSESDTRLMLRLLAFLFHADASLQFSRGLCIDDEPEIWAHTDDGRITLWIELGHPDEKRLRLNAHHADKVILYCYQGASSITWWQQHRHKLSSVSNLEIFFIPEPVVRQLTTLLQRSMKLQCTIQDGQMLLTDGNASLLVEREPWQLSSIE